MTWTHLTPLLDTRIFEVPTNWDFPNRRFKQQSIHNFDARLPRKNLRHIQLRDEKVARSPEIKKLLKQAIAERRPYE